MESTYEIKMDLMREAFNKYLARGLSDFAFLLRVSEIMREYR